jgi:hypothetical protein
MSLENSALLGSQNARTLLLSGTLTLEALVKGNSVAVVTAEVVQVLDLVETNNPVLTSEGLLQRVELGTLRGELGATNPVDRLARREEALVVVVGHLVPVVGSVMF